MHSYALKTVNSASMTLRVRIARTFRVRAWIGVKMIRLGARLLPWDAKVEEVG